MTIVILDWENVHLHGDVWISHHRLRHRLFVERLGWEVPSFKAMEYDQFDTPAAKYVLWVDDNNKARGMVRLIPTIEPYMVRSLWPDWLEDALPEDPHIWEATRFGCDRDLPQQMRRQIITDLICACQSFGVANGITKYLSVMPLGIFKRVIKAAGCPVDLLSERRLMAGHPTAVAYIDVSQDILETVRERSCHKTETSDRSSQKTQRTRGGFEQRLSLCRDDSEGIYLALSYLEKEALREGHGKLAEMIKQAAGEARAQNISERL